MSVLAFRPASVPARPASPFGGAEVVGMERAAAPPERRRPPRPEETGPRVVLTPLCLLRAVPEPDAVVAGRMDAAAVLRAVRAHREG